MKEGERRGQGQEGADRNVLGQHKVAHGLRRVLAALEAQRRGAELGADWEPKGRVEIPRGEHGKEGEEEQWRE